MSRRTPFTRPFTRRFTKPSSRPFTNSFATPLEAPSAGRSPRRHSAGWASGFASRPARWSVARTTVVARRHLVRHPWIHWAVVGLLAALTAAAILDHTDGIDAERRAWGRTRDVLVTENEVAPGQPIVASERSIPIAMVPDRAVDPAAVAGSTMIARQAITPGEIVTEADLAGSGPLPLLPAGWLAVPIVESPPSGAELGERVRLASDGIVLSRDALVVGGRDDVTLVAVPEEEAPAIAPASAAGSLVALRVP